jgi:hypothetical protein
MLTYADVCGRRCEFVRGLAYTLLLRAARLSPLAAASFAEKHLECLHSEDPGVRASGTPSLLVLLVQMYKY